MANRHKFAKGGKVKNAYGNPDVEKEAKEKHDKPGAIEKKAGGRVPGRKSGGRVDKFARGGGVGSDHSPFSSAHVKGTMPGGNPPPHGGHGKG
jgi:hypothetical protein